MNNFIIKTIKFLGVALIVSFAFANEVFAAPSVTPVSVQRVSDTSVRISSFATNELKNTVVWFEWGETQNPTTSAGLTKVFGNGLFETKLTNLTPGTTYYFRAVAMEGGNTVYSATSPYTLTVKTKPETSIVTAVAPSKDNTEKTPAPSAVKIAEKTNTTSSSGSVGATGGARVQTYEKEQNGNTASVAGATSGDSIYPNSLLEWVLVFIAILAIFLVGHMIMDSREKRKEAKKLEEKRKLEESYKNENLI